MPGYLMHLSEGRLILQLLEREYGFYLPSGWKNHFLLGCLLPDTKKGAEKQVSHYWDKERMHHLKRRPRPQLFEEKYREFMEDPGILGYLCHLQLDEDYMTVIWDKRMTFLNKDGVEEDVRDRIKEVRLDGVSRPVPVQEFLSSSWLYGDYTRLNSCLLQDYPGLLPVYHEEDWQECPIDEVDPKDLCHVLHELQELLLPSKDEKEEHTRFLQYEWIRNMIERSAVSEAKRIAERLRSFPQSGDVDLHAHTCYSDGSLTPGALVRLAMRRRLKAIAVTDHDTMGGIAEAREVGARLGIEVIPGMEFSTEKEGHDVHMVGLFLNPDAPALQDAMEIIVARRNHRNMQMIQRLREIGIEISDADMEDLGKGILTRANLAGLLMKKGAVDSVAEAFERYLSPGCPGYVPKVAIRPEEAVALAHEAGGLVFVAHYYQIDKRSLSNSYRICENILQAGADGLETIYCAYDEQMMRQTEELADRYHCLRSGGSDYHGTCKPGLELGYGYGNLEVPLVFVDRMKEVLSSRVFDLDVDKNQGL